MEVRRDPKSFLFFIILLLLINSPEPQQQTFSSRSHYDEVLTREWDELEILNRTQYGDFDAGQDRWLNITGLRDEDSFAWDLLGPVQERAKEQTKGLLGETAGDAFDGTLEGRTTIPLYRNASGYVEGEWVRSPLGRVRHPSDLNSSDILLDNPFPIVEYERNLTGTGGMVRLYITETEGRMRTDENRSISEITVRMIIGDHDSVGGNWWELVLNGIHFPKFGGSIVTTTSEKFSGIFALPHFSLSQHLYSASQKLLNRTIHETIERQLSRAYPIWNPWTSASESSDGMGGNTHCEFVLFLQEHPVAFDQTLDQNSEKELPPMDWLERELRYPTGAPLPRRTPLSLSMVGFSPDCGFVIESKGPPDYSQAFSHLTGSKTEEFNDRARHGIMAFAATLSLQLLLLVKQMKETATPSTRNRISFYTIAMLALGDGFAFLALIFMHLFLGTSQLALYSTAFLALFLGVFELRFLMDIWTVQATEQLRQERQHTTPTPAPPPPTQSSDTLPPPVTTARPPASPPIIIGSDQDEPMENGNAPAGEPTTTVPGRAELGTLYSRYCLLLIGIFFVTLQFTTVRLTVRSFYFNMLSFLYLSFWCPQIYRNIMRNCRKALRWDFVLGQSFVRMIPITYFYAVSDNVLFSRNDLTALMILAGWVWVQILALASQELLGSRFFIREGWAPPAYDYHPVLREDEEDATMPIGSAQSPEDDESGPSSMSKAGESKGKGKKVFDCSICTQDIEVPVVPSGASSENAPGLGGMILQRRAYMVTPCRHIFHTPCLEGWMRYRLQCPNCREILPPL
ncbi:hypothetical protein BCR34DRAFT_649628 [Clohesyomyces aquaticus]|uniref:DSC E3 ubiquitin ligase complex subunit A n=1 Tax=Clohesyomyces aquaticus TaxID=1231657 RepID=A0A1Y1ZSF4_9PLEO|nr:hypothetical protein BCR34DRAFT_649628 [Clohesyomyces aquaticus]